jgi:hypothetical protein
MSSDEHHPLAAGLCRERVGEREEGGQRRPRDSAFEEVGGQGELIVELVLALEGPRSV